LIEIENLTRKFDGVTAVDGLSLRVDEGEVFALLGPNGAGKTTTVRMLTCLIAKTSGAARIGEYDIGNPEESQKIRKMVGLLPENVGLYEELSAYDNLDIYGRLYKCSESQRRETIEHLLSLLNLWDKRGVATGTFSKGMKQKLAIARALIHDPQILFLDEPTANLDPEASKTVREFVLELKKQKRTIILNTHNLDEAERICDRVGILKTRLISVGSPAELKQSLHGRKTVVQLENSGEEMASVVERLGSWNVNVSANKLVITVSNPERENPDLVSAIAAAGGRIQFVTEESSTLEDVYLQLVRDN
jgi:ABC-2 type transport system ATP-binding protein